MMQTPGTSTRTATAVWRAIAVSALLASAGCSDSSPPDDTRGVDAAAPALDAPSASPDGASQGSCTNPEDVAGREAEYDGKTFDVIVSDCARDCISTGEQCTTDCVREAVANNVSEMCVSCFSALVQCSIDNCLLACLADQDAPACTECRCGDNDGSVNCVAAFDICSGLGDDECSR